MNESVYQNDMLIFFIIEGLNDKNICFFVLVLNRKDRVLGVVKGCNWI